MNIKLLKLFELCSKHKISFIYKTKEQTKNSIEFNLNEKTGKGSYITILQ
jgi:hypothetical protein